MVMHQEPQSEPVVWGLHTGSPRSARGSAALKPVFIIIIGILGQATVISSFRPYPPFISSIARQISRSHHKPVHRYPGGGEGRVTQQQWESNPQPHRVCVGQLMPSPLSTRPPDPPKTSLDIWNQSSSLRFWASVCNQPRFGYNRYPQDMLR